MLGLFIQKPDLLLWVKVAERVGYSPSLFEHPAIFSATCTKSA
jgi:hypothetical protein